MLLYATCTMLPMDILAMCEQEDPGHFGVPRSQVVWWQHLLPGRHQYIIPHLGVERTSRKLQGGLASPLIWMIGRPAPQSLLWHLCTTQCISSHCELLHRKSYRGGSVGKLVILGPWGGGERGGIILLPQSKVIFYKSWCI